jgi:hypothetical protein
MILTVNELKLWSGVRSLVEWELTSQELVAAGQEIHVFFRVRQRHGSDFVGHVASKVLIFGLHLYLKRVGNTPVWSTGVLGLLVYIDMLIACDNEASAKRLDDVNLDLLIEWGVRDVCDVGSIGVT